MLDKIKAKRHAKVLKRFNIPMDKKQDKKMVDTAVHEHEHHMHPGKKLTKLKDGGSLSENKSHPRLDKLARGGKHKKAGTKVNVIVAPQGSRPPIPVPVPVKTPAMPPQAVPGNAPMLPPQAGNMPMKCGGRKYKTGGSIGEGMTAGALSGEGRLEKIKLHRKRKKD